MKYIAFTLALFLGMSLHLPAQERPQAYSVVGIPASDTLSVRSRPSGNSSIVARLRNGTTGIRVVGQPIMNGGDDWVPIIVSDIKGWVRPKYLSSRDAATRAATNARTTSEDLPAVDLSIPADWRLHSREWTRVYGAAANGDIDEARRRLARGEGGTLDDIRYGWADYLAQQRRIRFWTPIIIAAGIAAADAMLKADSGPSQDEAQSRYEYNKGVIEYERQRREESERREAEARANAERAPY
ncbi:MAG TPA: SH3 domain-containing protein [Chthoniobacterales bacterium]|nr:SH3 domain-containing protein [Chthoniobacterales bacterium]